MVALDDIAAARTRIAGVVQTTPLRVSEWLSSPRAAVLLKIETVQPTASYKIRGAVNAAQRVRDTATGTAPAIVDGPRLVTASAGNHGKALAHAAKMLGLPLVVFIAADAPRAKIDAIRQAGAELRECADYDAAERAAKAHAATGGAVYISPYSHPDVIAGAGTIGLELLEQEPGLDAVVVPIGGGGLISGVGIALKALNPKVRVIGVEVEASCPFTKSLAAGRLVAVDVSPSLADGLTGNLDPDTITLDIVRDVVDEIAVVDEPLLRRALAGVVRHEHLLIEGAAAAGVAAVLGGKIQLRGKVAVILTGANIDVDRLLSVFTE
ncbi:MAG TPA: pyridoxal-phosphate dependent enzyme [Vicinamibacterales bacterium]|nr:pyridoxal-phosphate dependent enzyme [Vicinamibacterales bacterium]